MFAKAWIFFWLSAVTIPSLMGQEHWPRFRGPHASGIAHNQNLPNTWDIETGRNVAWKVAIPGLSHASPIVWQDTVFMVTAQVIEGKPDSSNSSTANKPDINRWEVWAIHLKTGEILWQQVAHSAPVSTGKMNFVSTAHATPATDGKVVVAMFDSQGMHAFDMAGNKLWQKNFGAIGFGDFEGDNAGWQHASSPIIHQGLVFLQCDTPADKDFLVALNSQTGKEIWRAPRKEVRSYGTPTWMPGSPNEIVTNGGHFLRGYNATTGQELWRLAGSSQDETAPVPIFNKDLILLTSGKRQVKPMVAIRRGARGNLTLSQGDTSSKDIRWSSKGLGPYLPAPIIAEDLLYSVNDKGIFTCFEIATGKQVYRARTPGGGVITASLVAADGNIYVTKMEGDILVVPTGRNFEVTSVNKMGEDLVATPAFAKETMLIRSKSYLYAIRKESSQN